MTRYTYSERRKLRRRRAVVLALLLPVLVLGMLAIWTAEHDLARHEQLAASAGLWFGWLVVTAFGVGLVEP